MGEAPDYWHPGYKYSGGGLGDISKVCVLGVNTKSIVLRVEGPELWLSVI
jgi:hypothetical protein